MLGNNHSLKKLNILRKHKVEPQPMAGNVSLDDLAFLVKRLSVQVDDLVEENNQKKTPIDMKQQQLLPLPPLPTQETTPEKINTSIAPHTIIDPWASYVPQNYGALLQRLEDIESLQKCPNECCASTGTVSSADGVPWPQPIEPFRPTSPLEKQDTLDVQYTHWCTLMRCLPLMDPITSAHVKTVGLYAMREILKSKASQKREYEPIKNHCIIQEPTTSKLRDSMSCLNVIGGLATTAPTATQDMPSWMTTSETKTALDSESTPNINETPAPSPLNGGKRFQKWVQYKKLSRKTNTDTANTPMGQSQTLRKIGSWFF